MSTHVEKIDGEYIQVWDSVPMTEAEINEVNGFIQKIKDAGREEEFKYFIDRFQGE